MERVKQVFTFGCGQTFPNHYVVIESKSSERCRQIMFDTFGEKWCMQYDEEQIDEIKNFDMKLLMTITELSDMRLVTEMHEQTIIRL